MGLIRTLLAISVVLAHSSPIFGIKLVGGQVAVQAFYMISGFYMTLVLNEKYVGANKSYKLFITNRLLRLWPVYWTVLVVSIILSLFIYNDPASSIITPFHLLSKFGANMSVSTLFFLVISNLLTLFQDWILFLGLNTETGGFFFTENFRNTNPLLYRFMFVPQAWTVGVEISFYLIAPFIVRRKIRSIILLVLGSALLRISLMMSGFDYDPWTYRFFPTELLFFLLGTISYHLYIVLKNKKISNVFLYTVYVMIIFVTFLYGFVEIDYQIPIYLLLFFISIPFVFMLSKHWKIDRYIGELSYPIYISHMLVSTFVSYSKIPTYGGRTFTLLALTIIVSLLLNELVAKKVEVIRQKRVKKV